MKCIVHVLCLVCPKDGEGRVPNETHLRTSPFGLFLVPCRDPYHAGRHPLASLPSIILSLITPPPYELVHRLQPAICRMLLTHPVCFTGGWPHISGGMYDPWRMPMPNSGMGGCALRSVVMPSIWAGGLLSRSLLFGPVRLGSSAQLSAC